MGFTSEEAAVLFERPSVGGEARFENEADLRAVAEVFRAAQTHAGAEFAPGVELEFAVGIAVPMVGVGVHIGKARVDEAVDLDVRGEGRPRKKGRAQGEGGERFLHDAFSWTGPLARPVG